MCVSGRRRYERKKRRFGVTLVGRNAGDGKVAGFVLEREKESARMTGAILQVVLGYSLEGTGGDACHEETDRSRALPGRRWDCWIRVADGRFRGGSGIGMPVTPGERDDGAGPRLLDRFLSRKQLSRRVRALDEGATGK